MIDVFANDSRFRDEYNSLSSQDREDGVTMCEIYDKIMFEGEEKGRAEGRLEGVIGTLTDLVKKGLITVVQAGLTVAEFQSKAGLRA